MADSETSGVLAIVQKVAKPLYSIVKEGANKFLI